MPKRIYLKEVSKIGEEIVCKEVDTSREWVVSKDVFNRFEWSGFPLLPHDIAEKVYSLFKGIDFKTLDEKEKKELVNHLIEVATGHRVGQVFPNLA